MTSIAGTGFSMRAIRAVVTTSLIATASMIAATSADVPWPLAYAGRSTNDAMSDPGARASLRALLPHAVLDTFEMNLGGPPAHAAVGATAGCSGLSTMHQWSGCKLSITSLAYRDDSVPIAARQAIQAWLVEEDVEVEAASFTGRDGRTRPLDAAGYAIPDVYKPPPAIDILELRIPTR